MNWSLEVARAMTGGIGIVLTIPITIALMEVWLKCEVLNNERNNYFRIITISTNDYFRGKKGLVSFFTLF